MKIQKLEDCRKVYRDIIAGYSAIKNPRCFLKHLKETDLGSLENRNEAILEELKAKKIPTEKEVLVALDKKGIWTKKNEEDYFALIQSIKDLEMEKRKIVSREQVETLLEFINSEKKRLEKITTEREGHLRTSAEYFIRKKSQEELIKISFFKDEELKELLFDQQTFDDLEFKELALYYEAFHELSETMGEGNLRKISVTPMFLNAFSLANDDPYSFYGRFITDLTVYQIELFNYGKLNKFILDRCDKAIEDYSDLNKVVLWYDAEYSIALGKAEEMKRDSRKRGI